MGSLASALAALAPDLALFVGHLVNPDSLEDLTVPPHAAVVRLAVTLRIVVSTTAENGAAAGVVGR